ncbi:MAG: KOW domain-containing RNA-binding protein [Candidatus Fimenecus sp.]
MEFCKGELVVCTAGREKERLMCVVGCDESYVYLCDGKERPLRTPKRKNPKHTAKTGKKLSESAMRTDKALRKALLREV